MSTLYTDLAGVYNSSTGIHDRTTRAQNTSGELKWIRALYTTTTGTDEADDDVLYVARAQPGMLFMPNMIRVTMESTALGAATQLVDVDLGLAYDNATDSAGTTLTDDPDYFADGLVLRHDATVTAEPGRKLIHQAIQSAAGGDATESLTVTGLTASDTDIVATIVDNQSNNDLYLIDAVAGSNAVTLTYNEDPVSGAKTNVAIYRDLPVAESAFNLVPLTQGSEGWITMTLNDVGTPVASKKILVEIPFLNA